MASQNGLRRKRLFNQDPHCHWCKCLTVWENSSAGEVEPDNLATVDHLFSRLSGKKTGDNNSKQVTVLSCKKCNQDRAKAEEKAMGRVAFKAYSDDVFRRRCEVKAWGRIIMGEHKIYAI